MKLFQNKGSLWYFSVHTLFSSGLQIMIGFAVSIIIARSIGPQGKGSYDLLIATCGLASTFLGLSLPSGIIYIVAQGAASLGSLALILLLVAGGISVLSGLLLVLLNGTPLITAFIPAGAGSDLFIWVSVCVLLTTLSGYWYAIFLGRQRIIENNYLNLVSKITNLLLLILASSLLVQSQRTYLTFFLAFIGAQLLGNAFYLIRLIPSMRFGNSGFGKIVNYSIPCYLANLSQFLNYRLDVFFVGYFQGAAVLGIYTLAVSLAQMIWLISNAFASNLFPRVAANDLQSPELNVKQTNLISKANFWISLVIAIIISAIGHPLITLVFGNSFRQSYIPLLILLPGIVLFSMVNIQSSYYAGIGRQKINLLLSSVSLVVTVVLDVLLIPRFSIIGASIASTASYSVCAFTSFLIFRKVAGVSIRNQFIPNSDEKTSVVKKFINF